MPIYAYKCEACGHAQDILRKISDPPLSDCPQCGVSALVKQVTAAGFQLKGSGWYVTDFKGGAGGKSGEKADSKDAGPAATPATAEAAPAAGGAPASTAPAAATQKEAASSPAPAPTPACSPSGAN